MTPLDQVVVVGTSLAAGVIGAIVGIGGGFLIVPMLIFIFGLSAQVSAGTSLVSLIFTGLSGAIGYTWQRRIDYKVGLLLALASGPGAIVGSIAGTYVTSSLLTAFFGCFMILVSIYIYFANPARSSTVTSDGWPRSLIDKDGKLFKYRIRRLALGFPFAFAAGVLAGFFGIGGGALQVPVMILILGVPIEIATATSTLMIVVSALTGAATHMQLGNVAYQYVPLIIVSVIAGAQIGVQVQRRTSARGLRRMFSFFLVIVGIRMILVLIL